MSKSDTMQRLCAGLRTDLHELSIQRQSNCSNNIAENMRRSGDKHKGGLNIRPIRRFAVGVLTFTEKEKPMIIKIDFCQIERSELRKAVVAAFDLLSEKETGGIFRDDYGIVCKEKPGQIILEVSDDTDEDTRCFVWQDERWHEVEY